MGSFYWTAVPDILRDAGINVITIPGYERRSRATGGFDLPGPFGMSVHHTAGSMNGIVAATYGALQHVSKPICNIEWDRQGNAYVAACGASNTVGAGGPLGRIKGPGNYGNPTTFGNEIQNRGTGEPYPEPQQEAVVVGLSALYAVGHEEFGWEMDIPVDRLFAHFEWAPTRKIDPAGPSRWWDPNERYGKWRMVAFRSDVATRVEHILWVPPTTPTEPTTPTDPVYPTSPTPPSGDIDMAMKLVLRDVRNDGVYLADETSKTWLNSGDAARQLSYRVMEAQGKQPNYDIDPEPMPANLPVTGGVAIDGYHYCVITNGDPNFFASYGPFVGPVPPGLDQYGR